MIEKNYYSLRVLETNAFHAKDDLLKTTNRVLHIGETSDCGIRYEAGEFEPERYASIVENEDGKSWRLIQRSQHVRAKIAGSGGFGLIHQLKDGDVICFEGQDMELEFHTHFDSSYGKEGLVIEHVVIEQPSKNKLLYFMLSGILLVLCAMCIAMFYQRPPNITYNDLEKYRNSVYLIRVDSVQWIAVYHGDTIMLGPAMIPERGCPVGTAFLTKDRKLITARHCIEYWIADDIDDILRTRKPDIIRKWAILSESFTYPRRENTDSVQMLRVFFSIHKPDETDQTVFTFTSTDSCVHINRFHDEPMEFGDYDNLYYWRSIHPEPGDPDRELGDIVCIDVDIAGDIELADSAMIAALNQSSSIGIFGLPGNLSGRSIKHALGHIMENRNDTTVGTNPDIQFDANITNGFSGGPVFVKAGNNIVVAGVVSKIDTENGIYKKAVPVTEIDYMIRKEKEDRYVR